MYDSDQLWAGKIAGQNAPAEVYYYPLTYYIVDGCHHTAKSNVLMHGLVDRTLFH